MNALADVGYEMRERVPAEYHRANPENAAEEIVQQIA